MMALANITATSPAAERTSARVHVQKFGTFLSNMVMPNIGAFIAWGLITALFIEVGWLPKLGIGADPGSWVAHIGGWGEYAGGGIVGAMITYLLPIIIGYTGGYNIYDKRGGVVGAIATMGVIAGSDIPMFLGAMVMGPLGGWSMKKLDALWSDRIRPGFEMLVNNFSAGIWGGILATFGFFIMSPIVKGLTTILSSALNALVDRGLLPLTSIIIEPAKVLFLNNAINHGIITSIATPEANRVGKSVLFLLEANPGPGLGLLLAYMFFGRGQARASAPGAAIIHFLGGIHEIYFPYVLMKPRLLLAMIASGMTGVFINVLFGVGLRAPAAPGSILAVYASTYSDAKDYIGVTLSVLGAAAVSFFIGGIILKADKSDEGDLAAATAQMESMKGKKSSVSGMLAGDAAAGGVAAGSHSGPIHDIVFACDAGMGSSAMGASVLRNKIKAAGFSDVTVVNKAISTLTDTFDLVVTHQDLTPRAKERTGSAIHVSVDNFMGSPRYDEIVELLHSTNREGGSVPVDASPSAHGTTAAPVVAGATASAAAPVASTPAAGASVQASDAAPAADASPSLLPSESIVLNGTASNRDEAITEAGRLLVAAGAVDEAYVDSMHDREASVSTYMGNLLAIPHGTNEAKGAIKRTGLSFVRYPEGVEWNGNPVKFVLAIAGAGDDHLQLLSKVAEVFLDNEKIAELERAQSKDDIQAILGSIKN